MKLSVLERILLLNALPSEGSLTTIMIIRELRESLSFSEDEHKVLNFRDEPNGSIKWTENIDKEVEIIHVRTGSPSKWNRPSYTRASSSFIASL